MIGMAILSTRSKRRLISWGVSLDYRDSQSSQDNQIRAIKDFTAGEVDVIGVMPVVTDGYDGVFQVAKEASIPIIVVDRRADVPEDLYTTYLASDFVEEGRQAARVLAELTGGQANIVELAGIEGDYVAIERGQSFRDVLPEYPGMKILASEDRGFNIPESKPVMAGLLQQYGDQIDALYAHNDQMARGAIEAIEEYGLRPGVDIKIVSIGGGVEGRTLEEIAASKINASVEYGPKFGPQFFELALKLANGEPVPKHVIVEEGIVYPADAARMLAARRSQDWAPLNKLQAQNLVDIRFVLQSDVQYFGLD